MTTFKQKILAGEIKRADAMKVQLGDLHVEPGFNLRQEGEDLEASISALADHIAGGGQYPALEVRPRPEGGVWIVDGHRRHRAIPLAIERGAQLADKDGLVWVHVVPFTGNDADRVARIITSAEGRGLSPLETAMGYKRLAAFGWDAERIAKVAGKTRQHVDQLLVLANGNSDVHAMVTAGNVSAALAVDAVRKHGDDAGKFLAGQLEKAKAGGKAKVTAGTIKGKAISRDQVNGLYDSVDAVADGIDTDTRARLTELQTRQDLDQVVEVKLPAWAILDLLAIHDGIRQAKAAEAQRVRDAAAKAAQTEIKVAA